MCDKGGIFGSMGKRWAVQCIPLALPPNKLEDGAEPYLIPDAK